jgi:hypothetical protein
MEDYWFPIANTILGVRQSAERVEALSVDQGSLGGEGPESRIRGEIEYVSVEAITLGGDFLSLGGDRGRGKPEVARGQAARGHEARTTICHFQHFTVEHCTCEVCL